MWKRKAEERQQILDASAVASIRLGDCPLKLCPKLIGYRVNYVAARLVEFPSREKPLAGSAYFYSVVDLACLLSGYDTEVY